MTKIQTTCKEHRKFIEISDLVGRDFYEFYKENRLHTSKTISNHVRFKEAIGGMMQSILRVTTKTNGGLDIENFGYFCYVRSKKKRHCAVEKNPLKKHIKKYSYYLYFQPVDELREWYIDPKRNKFPKRNDYYFAPESGKAMYELRKHADRLDRSIKDTRFLT